MSCSRSTPKGDRRSGSFKNPSVRPVETPRGKPMRNWDCACVPGILGPPRSVVPLALQKVVEASARSSPISWSISGYSTSFTATVSWSAVPGPLSGAAPLPTFPSALLNLLDHPATTVPPVEPAWTVSFEADILTATLSWSSPAPAAPAASPPVSPLPSSPYSDAGYFSASPSATNFSPSPSKSRSFADVVASSPVASTIASPSWLPDTSDVAVQVSSTNIFKQQQQDAQTATEPTPATSIACQTPSSAVPDQTSSSNKTFPHPLPTCETSSQTVSVSPKTSERSTLKTAMTQTEELIIQTTIPKSVSCQTAAATTTSSSTETTSTSTVSPVEVSCQTVLPHCRLCLEADINPDLIDLHLLHCPGIPTHHDRIETFLTKWSNKRKKLTKPMLRPLLDYASTFCNDLNEMPESYAVLVDTTTDLFQTLYPDNSSQFYYELSTLFDQQQQDAKAALQQPKSTAPINILSFAANIHETEVSIKLKLPFDDDQDESDDDEEEEDAANELFTSPF